MKLSSAFAFATLATISVLVPQRAHAQSSSWRCDGPDCTDALINDIEDLTVSRWPARVTLPMPPIGYTCARANNPDWDNPSTQGALSWSLVFTGALNPFGLDRHIAFADFSGRFDSTGSASASGSGQVDLALQESTSDVLVNGGDSGVSDLGVIQSKVTGGEFWNGSVSFSVPTGGGIKVCQISVGSAFFQISGGNGSAPISALDVPSALGDALRQQFRAAVATGVNGSP